MLTLVQHITNGDLNALHLLRQLTHSQYSSGAEKPLENVKRAVARSIAVSSLFGALVLVQNKAGLEKKLKKYGA